jgi:Na+-transporting methylmalonyl-CoA/oxaloacetate decarboxylase gamma subunit
MFVEGLIFFIFLFILGSIFYCMGKVFYDNDEVRA